MAPSRHVIVAGAGIAGLTAAMTLSRAGFRASVLEQSPKLEETGAGLQLSPNATRILFELGLRDRLEPFAVKPQMIRVMAGGSGREITRIPLGDVAERRYGAPFWVMHRGDLQAALEDGARDMSDIEIKLGHRFDDFATHSNGVTVQAYRGKQVVDERGAVLIGADGIWSAVGERWRAQRKPAFSRRTAWRALIPADAAPEPIRAPVVHLFLGLDAHLVAYPVKGGKLINIVGIIHDDWNESGWNAPGNRDEILRHFAPFSWAESVRDLIRIPDRWLKWALLDRATPFSGGTGPVTLIGDAAHPMLPFLAQGAGMAIEDAAVLADKLKEHSEDPEAGLRAYEKLRRGRTARAQATARKQGSIYGRTGPEATVRNIVMRMLGGERLLKRYDWVYKWRRS
ncbi:FAD-dependent monooxygenase [Pseudolabrys sp. Root1462]|uniref:FAD-dependent monooxygenase n=1 Tax=Pseudolabrys sp. Root1462 TaxID=1736466 RepID=UPI0009E79B70|nr:FAD-dependent monooxygenase [Pseudolabrys sp. Root1462]